MERLDTLFAQNNFNSIKVRLRLVGTDFVTSNNLFQFHKGSIKTSP